MRVGYCRDVTSFDVVKEGRGRRVETWKETFLINPSLASSNTLFPFSSSVRLMIEIGRSSSYVVGLWKQSSVVAKLEEGLKG